MSSARRERLKLLGGMLTVEGAGRKGATFSHSGRLVTFCMFGFTHGWDTFSDKSYSKVVYVWVCSLASTNGAVLDLAIKASSLVQIWKLLRIEIHTHCFYQDWDILFVNVYNHCLILHLISLIRLVPKCIRDSHIKSYWYISLGTIILILNSSLRICSHDPFR